MTQQKINKYRLPGNVPTPGTDGLSAYQIAVNNGFSGTEQEWLDSLVGADGAEGPEGPQGPAGLDGQDGLTTSVNGISN